MLADLPSEIIYHIATFLPTASSLTHLAQTCQRLHKIITADGLIFRAFVQRQFSVFDDGVPPFWKDAAQALTSRSRALDRCGIIARFMVLPEDTKVLGVDEPLRHGRPTMGYRPALDSYEAWTGERWEDREEVLAWGAAEKVILRIRRTGHAAHEKWLRFNDQSYVSSHDDIRGVHLLRRNHPRRTDGNEHIIYGAGTVVKHVSVNPDDATYKLEQSFVTDQKPIHSLDLSHGTEPILAVHSYGGSISLYRTATEDSEVSPFSTLRAETEDGTPRPYSKFLSPTRLAVGYGRKADSIIISDIMGDQILTLRELVYDDSFQRTLWPQRKARVGAIAPLGVDTHGRSAQGEVFLAGWGNSRVRLHDLRSPRMYEREYIDVMDSNPVYCIQPMSNHFLVGAGAEALLNIFDLRMQNAYSHFNARVPLSAESHTSSNAPQGGGFSCFLSHHPPGASDRFGVKYRGPVYTMSSPSPTSATVYTGIVDGVLRLNFGSTDDLIGSSSSWYQNHLDLGMDEFNTNSRSAQPVAGKVLGLSGYERPSPENKSTCAKLRTQVPFWSLDEVDEIREREIGLDRRWRRVEVNSYWRSCGD